MSDNVIGEIPTLNLKNPGPEEEAIKQRYGGTDFRQVLQRNIEKDFIERQAALISVASKTAVFKSINNLYTIMETSAAGGVKVQFPISGADGNTGREDNLGALVPKPIVLDKANSTYRILHEVALEGGDPAENDLILEAKDNLGFKYDQQYLGELKAKKFGGNDVNGTNWLGSGGDPYSDINTAINKIISNSAIDPNAGGKAAYTCIAPIEFREVLQKITIVDGLKVGLAELIENRLNCQILYTRKPFHLADGETAPLVNEAIVIPTLDRHVGKFYTFNGGSLPSIFVTVDEHGKRVSTNSWAKYVVAPSEADGSLTENRRISSINTINA